MPGAPAQLGGERVEPLGPEPAELGHPRVDLLQRRGVDGIQPPGALSPHSGEPAVAEHLEVLRDGGVRDAELRGDGRRQLARGALTVREQLEQPAADRVAEDVEGVHSAILALLLN